MKSLKPDYSYINKAGRVAIAFLTAIFFFLSPVSRVFALEKATKINAVNDLNQSITSGELEQYTDDTINKNMRELNIPGAVISIVKDGKVVLLKGYGYSDIEKKTPVVPDKTKFRIASLTKLFTANAVMQLVEENMIDLDEDVNIYLKGFKLKNRYSSKVTVAQLLTHTSGIDSDVIGDLSEKESEVKSVSQFLKKRMLPVVREPGRTIQYSSYGMALAGCVVEEVSGLNCAEYISNNIFKPLGMKETSFKLNPSELSKAYISSNGIIKQQELKGYFNLYPVGGIVSTADDMAKFMIAHLNNGEYNGKRILNEKTAIKMHSRQTGFDAVLPGTCYGFVEGFRNGQRTIGHPGYSPDGFSSELCLIPEKNTGIFISINQGADNSFPQDFITGFIDHYFKDGGSCLKESTFNEAPDKKIQGTYRFGEYTRTTLNKGDLFGAGEDAWVSVNEDRIVTINETDPFTGKKTFSTAIQVAPMVFRNSDGEYFVFKLDNKGNVAYMAQTSNSWHGTYERINWYDENSFQIFLFTACCIFFLIELLLSLVYFVRGLSAKHKGALKISGPAKHLKLLLGTSSLLNLSFYGISIMTWGDRLRYGVPLDVKLLLLIPLASCLITALLVVGSIIAWKKKIGRLFFRLNISAAAIVCMVFIWIYNYWNFLGFKY